MRVLVQERRRLVRAGIARLLTDPHRGVEVVAVAADAEELLRLADVHRVDVVVLELEPGAWDVAPVVALLSERHPRCRFVALYHGRLEDHRKAADELGVAAVSYGTGAAGLRAAIRGRPQPRPPEGARPERRRLRPASPSTTGSGPCCGAWPLVTRRPKPASGSVSAPGPSS